MKRLADVKRLAWLVQQMREGNTRQNCMRTIYKCVKWQITIVKWTLQWERVSTLKRTIKGMMIELFRKILGRSNINKTDSFKVVHKKHLFRNNTSIVLHIPFGVWDIFHKFLEVSLYSFWKRFLDYISGFARGWREWGSSTELIEIYERLEARRK